MFQSFHNCPTAADLIEVLKSLSPDTKIVLAEGPPIRNCRPNHYQNRCSPACYAITGKYEEWHQDCNFRELIDADDQPATYICLFPAD